MANDQTDQELQALSQCPEALAYAKVVGCWIWVSFPSKPCEETRAFLKLRGYRWNGNRKAWQNSCGVPRPRAPYDPRLRYGQVAASELLEDTV